MVGVVWTLFTMSKCEQSELRKLKLKIKKMNVMNTQIGHFLVILKHCVIIMTNLGAETG